MLAFHVRKGETSWRIKENEKPQPICGDIESTNEPKTYWHKMSVASTVPKNMIILIAGVPAEKP